MTDKRLSTTFSHHVERASLAPNPRSMFRNLPDTRMLDINDIQGEIEKFIEEQDSRVFKSITTHSNFGEQARRILTASIISNLEELIWIYVASLKQGEYDFVLTSDVVLAGLIHRSLPVLGFEKVIAGKKHSICFWIALTAVFILRREGWGIFGPGKSMSSDGKELPIERLSVFVPIKGDNA